MVVVCCDLIRTKPIAFISEIGFFIASVIFMNSYGLLVYCKCFFSVTWCGHWLLFPCGDWLWDVLIMSNHYWKYFSCGTELLSIWIRSSWRFGKHLPCMKHMSVYQSWKSFPCRSNPLLHLVSTSPMWWYQATALIPDWITIFGRGKRHSRCVDMSA